MIEKRILIRLWAGVLMSCGCATVEFGDGVHMRFVNATGKGLRALTIEGENTGTLERGKKTDYFHYEVQAFRGQDPIVRMQASVDGEDFQTLREFCGMGMRFVKDGIYEVNITLGESGRNRLVLRSEGE